MARPYSTVVVLVVQTFIWKKYGSKISYLHMSELSYFFFGPTPKGFHKVDSKSLELQTKKNTMYSKISKLKCLHYLYFMFTLGCALKLMIKNDIFAIIDKFVCH